MMDKQTRNRIIATTTLVGLLLTTRLVSDRVGSNLNKRIIDYGYGIESMDDSINLVAHRGYSSMYPDNSLEGINACNELQCIEGIEVDVRLTKDDQLVLMHNDYIGFNKVSNFTYEELQTMDLKSSLTTRPLAFKGYNFTEQEVLAKRYDLLEDSGYTLCTLEDILKTRNKDKILFVDIKFSGHHDEVLLTKIGELLKGEENVIIQSFNGDMLALMMELYPDYTYQLLINSNMELNNIDYVFDAYGIKFEILREGTVEDLIEHDKQVSLWTVDSYRDFKELVDQYGEYNDSIYYISDNVDMLSYQHTKTLKKIN